MEMLRRGFCSLVVALSSLALSAGVAKADLAAVCPTIINLRNGMDIKYKSENVHGGRGPSFLLGCQAFPKSHWPRRKRFPVYNANGTQIGRFVTYAAGIHVYGWRAYTGLPGGSPRTADELLRRTQGTGTTNIYINTRGGTCFKVKNPTVNQGTIRPTPGLGFC